MAISNSGIYCIKNIINNKRYVGSTINFKHRKNTHFFALRHNKHSNSHLQRSYNKYGECSFVFEIVEECSPQNLLVREQFYLDTWFPEYNLLKIAGSTLGFKRSLDFKKQQSKRMKGNQLFKCRLPKDLKKHPKIKRKNFVVLQVCPNTLEVIQKYNSIKKVLLENLNYKKPSIYSCLKNYCFTVYNYNWCYEHNCDVEQLFFLKKQFEINSREICVFDLNGIFVSSFKTVKDAAIFLKSNGGDITRCCKQRSKTVKNILLCIKKMLLQKKF